MKIRYNRAQTMFARDTTITVWLCKTTMQCNYLVTRASRSRCFYFDECSTYTPINYVPNNNNTIFFFKIPIVRNTSFEIEFR